MKSLRLQLGFTHKDMGQILGITKSAYTNYETGRCNMPERIRGKLMKIKMYLETLVAAKSDLLSNASHGSLKRKIEKQQHKSIAIARQLTVAEARVTGLKEQYDTLSRRVQVLQILKAAAGDQGSELIRLQEEEAHARIKLDKVGIPDQVQAEYHVHIIRARYMATLNLIEKLQSLAVELVSAA